MDDTYLYVYVYYICVCVRTYVHYITLRYVTLHYIKIYIYIYMYIASHIYIMSPTCIWIQEKTWASQAAPCFVTRPERSGLNEKKNGIKETNCVVVPTKCWIQTTKMRKSRKQGLNDKKLFYFTNKTVIKPIYIYILQLLHIYNSYCIYYIYIYSMSGLKHHPKW